MRTLVAYQVYTGISLFLRALQLALLAYCLLSWFARPTSRIYIFLRTLVTPLLAPFRPLARRLMERGLMIDLSAFLAMLALQLLQRILPTIISRLFGV